jgi:hypothetical protein
MELGSDYAHIRFAGKLDAYCTWDMPLDVSKRTLVTWGVGDDCQVWTSKDIISEVCRFSSYTSALSVDVCHLVTSELTDLRKSTTGVREP